RFSPRAILKAIRRKPYRDLVPPFSSPAFSRRKTLKIVVLILLFPSICRSVTAWDHIFSDHIFSDCKSFVFCLKD
ncbi:hypothetical protein HID58_055896, partial [Brassica napus]